MRKAALLVLFMLIASAAFCQINKATSTHSLKNKRIYQERLILQTNNQFFVPGERVFFTVKSTLPGGKPSFISKISYLELIDEDKGSVLRTAVSLNNGYGYGHLYLPSHLETGDYQLIAYTSWMRNFDLAFIPQESLKIINPYEPLPAVEIPENLEISFSPEGGEYVLSRKNKIVYQINNSEYLPFNARVLNAGGDVLTTFSSDTRVGSFNLIPDSVGIYKVIVTTANDSIYFSELTIDKLVDIGISVTESVEEFSVWLFNATGQDEKLNIVAFDDPNFSISKKIDKDSIHLTYKKSELPKGLLNITMTNGSGEKIQRLIFNQPEIAPATISTHQAVVGTRQKIEFAISPPADLIGEKVMVFVQKKYGDTGFNPIHSSLLTAGLADPVYNPVHHFNDPTLLNNMLITQKLKKSEPNETVTHLPDYRGQLISGKLKDTNEEGNIIYLASSSPHYKFYASKTNSKGEFYFNLNGLNDENEVILYSSGSKVEIRYPFITDHSFVQLNTLSDDKSISEWLLRKSIDVQVENAYFQFRQDSVIEHISSLLKDNIDQTYVLDDYTRFPTIEDLIIEIIEEITIKKRNGHMKLFMPYIENASSNVDSMLMLLNGIPVTSEYLRKFNPLLIEKVDLVKRQLKIGGAEFRGIANFITFGKDEENFSPLPGYSKIRLLGPQSKVSYYQPDYASTVKALDKMPDFRNLLLWEPGLVLENENTLNFYTSDLTGTFSIIVYGQSHDGRIIYGKRELVVKEIPPNSNK